STSDRPGGHEHPVNGWARPPSERFSLRRAAPIRTRDLPPESDTGCRARKRCPLHCWGGYVRRNWPRPAIETTRNSEAIDRPRRIPRTQARRCGTLLRPARAILFGCPAVAEGE